MQVYDLFFTNDCLIIEARGFSRNTKSWGTWNKMFNEQHKKVRKDA